MQQKLTQVTQKCNAVAVDASHGFCRDWYELLLLLLLLLHRQQQRIFYCRAVEMLPVHLIKNADDNITQQSNVAQYFQQTS